MANVSAHFIDSCRAILIFEEQSTTTWYYSELVLKPQASSRRAKSMQYWDSGYSFASNRST